tara:strand:+ start:144 stop:428 length:285 start_codon:yes stop_codon:yes gene_type:complete
VTKSSEIFYKNLKQSLDECHTWPSRYLFKFIVENTPTKRKQLISLFDSNNISVKEKISSNAKYVSFSISKEVLSAESVIKTYKSVSKIEGIISL